MSASALTLLFVDIGPVVWFLYFQDADPGDFEPCVSVIGGSMTVVWTTRRAWGAWVLLSLLAGCGSSEEDPRGARVAAEGTVKLNDADLPAGRIIFLSNQGDGTVKATALVENGLFSFNGDNGPLTGTARVEIYPVEMDLEEFEKTRSSDATRRLPLADTRIPARYNTHSTLTAEVDSDPEQNVYTFALQTK